MPEIVQSDLRVAMPRDQLYEVVVNRVGPHRLAIVPAACGSVSISEGIAYFFNMSTVEAFRGRGCQKALIRERLAIAKAMGCDTALVQVSPGSGS